MNIVGMMLVRNEQWVLPLSIPAALSWLDHLVIVDDGSTDNTPEICRMFRESLPEEVTYIPVLHTEYWEEMALRQYMFEIALQKKPDAIALIDADEAITANVWRMVREQADSLLPGEALDLPMIPTWRSTTRYRNDRSVWSRGVISLLVRLGVPLHWCDAQDGYTHHARLPKGITGRKCSITKNEGGVFHLQFANWPRLVAKHAWYKMTERLRWPDRPGSSAEALNKKYGQALDETDIRLSDVPLEWWGTRFFTASTIDLRDPGWFAEECRSLMKKHGSAAFAGLDLFGVV